MSSLGSPQQTLPLNIMTGGLILILTLAWTSGVLPLLDSPVYAVAAVFPMLTCTHHENSNLVSKGPRTSVCHPIVAL